eukprot:2793425-Pyramimonas_sp.AAC.1
MQAGLGIDHARVHVALVDDYLVKPVLEQAYVHFASTRDLDRDAILFARRLEVVLHVTSSFAMSCIEPDCRSCTYLHGATQCLA